VSDDGPSLPGWVSEVSGYSDLLLDFLSNPRQFVVGAVLTTFLEVVFGVVSQLIDIVLLLFGGSEPGRFNAPGETLGLIDVPVYVADLLVDVGTDTGNAILLAIESMNDPVFALASNAGPATPVIITAIVVGEVIVVLWILQRLVFVLADLLQLGGLTE